MAGMTGSQITVNTQFNTKLMNISTRLKPLMIEAMDQAMMEIEKIARQSYDWNPPGTIVDYPNSGRHYQVTGAGVLSITAFAVGTKRDPYTHFSLTDPETGRVHEDDPSLNPPPPEQPDLIQGIVTMTEPHSAYLQMWEIRGPSDTSPRLQGGESIVTSVLAANEDIVITAIEREGLARLTSLF